MTGMTRKALPKKDTPEIRAYVAAVRAGEQSRHVIKTADGWAVKKVGADRASGIFETQKEAVAAAKKTTNRTASGFVFVHGRNGKIRERI